jgi:hypothetical protein
MEKGWIKRGLLWGLGAGIAAWALAACGASSGAPGTASIIVNNAYAGTCPVSRNPSGCSITASVDQGPWTLVPASASTTFEGLAPGLHKVAIKTPCPIVGFVLDTWTCSVNAAAGSRYTVLLTCDSSSGQISPSCPSSP